MAVTYSAYGLKLKCMSLVCKLFGHKEYKQESFSTYRSTDVVTGEILDHGTKKGKTYIFCSRCGKDLDKNVGNQEK